MTVSISITRQDDVNNRYPPGGAVVRLGHPVFAEKIYLLSANLTKTSKSHYPTAEIEIVYEKGENQVIPLIPPYNIAVYGAGLLSQRLTRAAWGNQKKADHGF